MKTDLEKVLIALEEHTWQATYCRFDNPMECYCGARIQDHDTHLAEEILKALDNDKEKT